jgi:scavenger receptor class B, member 1
MFGQAGLIAVQRDKAPFLDLATKAMNEIFKPTTPFLTASVMDILYDGIGIDCSSEMFEAKSLCGALENEKAITAINDTYLSFAILAPVSSNIISMSPRQYREKSIKY